VQLSNLMIQWLKRMGTFSIHGEVLRALSWEMIISFLLIVGPVLLIASAAAVLGHLIQGNNVLSWELLKPNWGKFNILNGLKGMFKTPALVELLKSFIKLLIVGWIAYSTIKKEWPDILCLFDQDVGAFSIISAPSPSACCGEPFLSWLSSPPGLCFSALDP